MFLLEKKAHAKRVGDKLHAAEIQRKLERLDGSILQAGLSSACRLASRLHCLSAAGLIGAAGDRGGRKMLYYTLVFLLVALIAGALGFGAVSFAAAGIAKICFFIFIVLFLVSLFMHIGRGASRSI